MSKRPAVFCPVLRTRFAVLHVSVLGLLILGGPAVGVGAEPAGEISVPAASDSGAALEVRGLGDRGQLESLLIWPGPEEASGTSAPNVLRGSDARLQLVVSGLYSSGQLHDLTRAVAFEVQPAGVVEIDASGFVTPLANGEALVTVRQLEGAGEERPEDTSVEEILGSTTISVTQFVDQPPVSFPNQITPIFTKHGCNGGGCHGKSGGQNGFRLSLLGFYPQEDHEYLVFESRGRRVLPAAPAQSLLLTKATNEVPHGGGARFDRESFEYRLIHRWMRQGMPYGEADDPHVVGVDVFPPARTMGPSSEQQLSVLARYSDGSVEDVSRMATYEPNDAELASVDARGKVRTMDLAGDVAVMVRYQGQVGVFRASVPLGAEIGQLPEPRNLVDEAVFAKLRVLGIPPSAEADDTTFLRRVTIDLAGRLPTAAEARAFLADASPTRREELIERLLASGDYADYFANKWAALLRNKKNKNSDTRGTFGFHAWLRESLRENRPYNEIVREVLAASGEPSQNPAVVWYRSVSAVEQQVEDTAQLFMGLRIQCARCHHHPFERWSQRDYYGLTAFFTRVGRKPSAYGYPGEERVFHQRGDARSKDPRSGESLAPTPLGGEQLALDPDDDPRIALVDWLERPDNPFFAKALVNRYWKHFFGRGLVDPEDDMRVTNPASNQELIDRLAEQFVASGFDLKALCRLITNSRVYQLSSEPNAHNAKDKQCFSRFYPRRLNAEVLYDGLHQVTQAQPSFGGFPANLRAVELPDSGERNYFLTVFGRPMADSACECERSNEANLAQSLHLLNSKDILGKIGAESGRAALLSKDSDRERSERLRELYLCVYARVPAEDEAAIAIAHLEKSENAKEAWEDIVWALLNTKEFLFNH